MSGEERVFSNPLVRTFSLASNPSACRHMALHLLSLGHRRVAFLSPITDGKWANNRGEALTQAFIEAGLPDAVTACTVPYTSPRRDSAAYTIVTQASTGDVDRLLAQNRDVATLRYRLDLVMQRETIRGILTPLMQQALDMPDVTAWVAANDDIALECMAFLQKHGRRVPHDVSVCGFDDSLEAFFRKLTSYHYNETGAVHALLSHLLDHTTAVRRHRCKAVSEIRGFVNVRGTTAPPLRPKACPR